MTRLSELQVLAGATHLAGHDVAGDGGRFPLADVAAGVIGNGSGFQPSGRAARSVLGRLAETVSVADFAGCDPTGVSASDAAFAAAIASVANGARVQIDVPPGLYRLNADVIDNGRFPLFRIAMGASFTGAGVLRCRAEWWTDPYAKRHVGSVAWAFGGQRGTAGQGALLIGGADPSEGLGGVYAAADGHGNWLSFTTARTDNPTEVNIYSGAASGRCTVTAGGNTITRVSGPVWTADRVKYWIGRAIGLNFGIFIVDARIDDNTLRLRQLNGLAVSWNASERLTYHFCLTTGEGSCVVTGTTIARTNGTPFNPFIDPGYYRFYTSVDGGGTWTQRTITGFVSDSALTSATAFGNGAYLFRWELDINQQLSTLRLQKLSGGVEENLTLSARWNEYEIRVGAGGSDPSDPGSYYPLTVYNGSLGAYQPKPVAQFNDGSVSLGGKAGGEALRAMHQTNVQRWIEAWGGPTVSGTDYQPTFRSRGSGASAGLNFDAQGTGGFSFSNNSFATPLLNIAGAAGTDSFIEINSGTGSAAISAKGATNADLLLAPNGAGALRFGTYTATVLSPTGYITIKDAAGNTRRLLVG